MKAISIFLENMQIVSPESEVAEVIQGYFNDYFQSEVILEYRKGKVYLSVPPALRSEVFLRKQDIQKGLTEKLERFEVKVSKII